MRTPYSSTLCQLHGNLLQQRLLAWPRRIWTEQSVVLTLDAVAALPPMRSGRQQTRALRLDGIRLVKKSLFTRRAKPERSHHASVLDSIARTRRSPEGNARAITEDVPVRLDVKDIALDHDVSLG
jgi:hypothetical protein